MIKYSKLLFFFLWLCAYQRIWWCILVLEWFKFLFHLNYHFLSRLLICKWTRSAASSNSSLNLFFKGTHRRPVRRQFNCKWKKIEITLVVAHSWCMCLEAAMCFHKHLLDKPLVQWNSVRRTYPRPALQISTLQNSDFSQWIRTSHSRLDCVHFLEK